MLAVKHTLEASTVSVCLSDVSDTDHNARCTINRVYVCQFLCLSFPVCLSVLVDCQALKKFLLLVFVGLRVDPDHYWSFMTDAVYILKFKMF